MFIQRTYLDFWLDMVPGLLGQSGNAFFEALAFIEGPTTEDQTESTNRDSPYAKFGQNECA
jgi:hypothetical protein